MTRLPYVRVMFATCMLFQVIYVLCVLLWLGFPDLKGHALLPAIFPNFTLLTIASFIYGLMQAECTVGSWPSFSCSFIISGRM